MNRCFEGDCNNPAVAKCSCRAEGFLSCASHAVTHLLSNGNHNLSPIVKKFKPQIKHRLNVAISTLLREVRLCQSEVNTEKKNAIYHIEVLANRALEDISKLEKYLEQEQKRIQDDIEAQEANYFDKILSEHLSVEEETKSFNIPFICSKLKYEQNFFCGDIYISIIKCFKSISGFNITNNQNSTEKSLFCHINNYTKGKNLINIYDLSKKHSETVSMDLGPGRMHLLCCNLPSGLIFCGGGRYHDDEYSNEFFIIDPYELIIVHKTTGMIVDDLSGCLYYNNYVYIFGSFVNKTYSSECTRFDINMKIFSRVAELPSPTTVSSSIFYDGNIILSAYSSNCVYVYCPVTNSYNKFMWSFRNNLTKNFLIYKEKIFLFYDGKILRKCGNGFDEWEQVNTFRMKPRGNIHESMQYNGKIIFRNGPNMFSMNPDTAVVECLLDIDHSKNCSE
ncbi:hypothetical protein SteCoe_30237 [Stentor coeruleus]|uniref:Uncharacterized protein n=1 Tax=Stentor coeruleus TaxID=5963 RepID=A0A1R2B437_9CILI|nr:hypothetical protein SteCoe_30237 [Stentor coeruleus]